MTAPPPGPYGPAQALTVTADAGTLIRACLAGDAAGAVLLADLLEAPQRAAVILAGACVALCRRAGMTDDAILADVRAITRAADEALLDAHPPDATGVNSDL